MLQKFESLFHGPLRFLFRGKGMPKFLFLEWNGTSGSLKSDSLNRDEGTKVLENTILNQYMGLGPASGELIFLQYLDLGGMV